MTRSEGGHSDHCIEMTMVAIRENNEATMLTEPDTDPSRLSEVSVTNAITWLAEGTISCYQGCC